MNPAEIFIPLAVAIVACGWYMIIREIIKKQHGKDDNSN
jgi:hypothetical protein